MDATKPFLKWAGGKRQLLPELSKYVPEKFGVYFEPFLGGGALFFHLFHFEPGAVVLGDTNELLVRSYLGIRDDVDAVINDLQNHYVYDSDRYYGARARHPHIAATSNASVAAWFVYMNKSGYNGLWRVNRHGWNNVPFGRYTNPTICDEPGLRAASRALQGVQLRVGDFEKTVAHAKKGDLCYFDPPYVPASKTSNFVGYDKAGFNLGDQGRLRDCALELKRRGVHVILSNSDTPDVRDLYKKGFDIRKVEAKRNINSVGGKRGKVGEVIIT